MAEYNKFGEPIEEESEDTLNSSYSIPVSEQETVVNWARRGENLTVWTSDRTVMTKLDKLVGNGHWELIDETDYSKVYSCDNTKAFSFRTGEKKRKVK